MATPYYVTWQHQENKDVEPQTTIRKDEANITHPEGKNEQEDPHAYEAFHKPDQPHKRNKWRWLAIALIIFIFISIGIAAPLLYFVPSMYGYNSLIYSMCIAILQILLNCVQGLKSRRMNKIVIQSLYPRQAAT